MSSGPVTAVVIEGEDCIKGFRSLAGATNPTEAALGSIRGDLGRDWGEKVQKNIVHGPTRPSPPPGRSASGSRSSDHRRLSANAFHRYAACPRLAVGSAG